jgi:hypothetical protein
MAPGDTAPLYHRLTTLGHGAPAIGPGGAAVTGDATSTGASRSSSPGG